MKVLHIISSGGMYGAEAVILNVSRGLMELGHESVLGVFSNSAHPNTQLQESAAAAGVPAFAIPCRGQIDRSVPRAIRELAHTTRADVVHAHGYKADVYAYLARSGMRVPLVSTCHTWYDNDLAVSLYGALDRWVLRSFAGVVAVSDEVRAKLLSAGVLDRRIRIIRNGIDLRRFDRAEDGNRRVGLVGRLAPEKGVDLFLRAAAMVLAEMPETQFVIAGDGPERAALESLIAQLGIGKRVTLAGQMDDMRGFYASLHVLVSASRQEGLPIALLEGMASRLPVVATAVGEVPKLVIHERTGLLVPPNDAESLGQAMLRLLRDDALRSTLAEAALRQVAEGFSSHNMTEEYLQLYQDVIASAIAGSPS